MPVRNLLNLVVRRPSNRHAVPPGQRVYAVGDIHGRSDLLDALLRRIEADAATRGEAETTIVFLGDLVDRGPDSRGVVERLIEFDRGPVAARFLMGNHEEVFLRALSGDLRALRFLIRIGGRETILSYGISERAYRDLDFEALSARIRAQVPAAHVEFLSRFEHIVEIGDYVFVHAGIRPGVGLEAQAGADLRWIRDDFLRHRDDFGKLVIHGHSISEDVDIRSNRIGIDTGAYASGRLTAIGLEGNARWFLSTEADLAA
jgi:serine/threonine protein phosphatase 1